MEEKVRCFIAINFPKEITGEVERVQEQINNKKIFVGRFIDDVNLHLTLKFLGEISAEEIGKVKGTLRKVGEERFAAKLGSLGVFSSNFIRIIWIKILGKGIFDLQKKIDDVLKDMFDKEERFMSHLTIARVKNVKDRKIFLQELKKINVRDLKFEVDRFSLIKSVLTEQGAEYSVLEEYVLK